LILGQQETPHTHAHTKHTHDLLASYDTSPLASKITHNHKAIHWLKKDGVTSDFLKQI
jgi:hypothetical protein